MCTGYRRGHQKGSWIRQNRDTYIQTQVTRHPFNVNSGVILVRGSLVVTFAVISLPGPRLTPRPGQKFKTRFVLQCVIVNRNRKLQTSKAPLKSQAQGTSLFTSAASNQRGFPKNSPWEAQVRLPAGERMRQIRGVFQRIVRGKLRSGCQKVRGGRLGVKAGVV